MTPSNEVVTTVAKPCDVEKLPVRCIGDIFFGGSADVGLASYLKITGGWPLSIHIYIYIHTLCIHIYTCIHNDVIISTRVYNP